jgi:putative transposase
MKPGTYTQLYIQLVFAVKNRNAVLNKEIRYRIFEYMSAIISGMNHKSIIVNGVSDHVHILLGLNPSKSISETVHDIKRNSSLFINNENLCKGRFTWQEGYGAFSYSRSQLDRVYNYILSQELHHSKSTFQEEYVKFLRNYEIDYNERFLFEFWNNV